MHRRNTISDACTIKVWALLKILLRPLVGIAKQRNKETRLLNAISVMLIIMG